MTRCTLEPCKGSSSWTSHPAGRIETRSSSAGDVQCLRSDRIVTFKGKGWFPTYADGGSVPCGCVQAFSTSCTHPTHFATVELRRGALGSMTPNDRSTAVPCLGCERPAPLKPREPYSQSPRSAPPFPRLVPPFLTLDPKSSRARPWTCSLTLPGTIGDQPSSARKALRWERDDAWTRLPVRRQQPSERLVTRARPALRPSVRSLYASSNRFCAIEPGTPCQSGFDKVRCFRNKPER